jgi:hypothetical protein
MTDNSPDDDWLAYLAAVRVEQTTRAHPHRPGLGRTTCLLRPALSQHCHTRCGSGEPTGDSKGRFGLVRPLR